MNNNYGNEENVFRHKHSYLTIIAIVLSVISILFSTFTLVTTRGSRHQFHMGKMSEMPCQMRNGDSFNHPNDMQRFGDNNFRFNAPDGNSSRNFGRNFSNDKDSQFKKPSKSDWNKWGDRNSKNDNKSDSSNNNSIKESGPTTAPETAPPSMMPNF